MYKQIVTTVTVEQMDEGEIPSHELLRQNINDSMIDRAVAECGKMRTRKRPIINKFVYTCKVCKQNFSEKAAYTRHMSIHNGITNCNICKTEFKKKKYLQRHMMNMHTDKRTRYKCAFCDKSFAYNVKLKNHERVHTGEKPHKCDVCGKAFSAQYSLKTHMFIHSDEKPFACTFCEYKCRDSSTLRKHQEGHMGIKRLYQCKKCNKTYTAKDRLKRHVAEFHLALDIRKHECDICKRKFQTNSQKNSHIRNFHEKAKEGNCDICGKYLSNMNNLAHHLISHTDERPYKCTVESCFKKFKTKHDMKKHEITHFPSKHYPCNICTRKFSRHRRMLSHIRLVHEKNKCIECDYCQSMFYSKNYLIKHINMVHSKRRNRYECDHCDFYSNIKPSLIMHIKAYHNKLNRTCKVCKKEFKSIGYLKVHYLSEHDIRHKKRLKVAKEPELTEPVKIKEEPLDIEEHNLEEFLSKAEIISADDISIPLENMVPEKAENDAQSIITDNADDIQRVPEEVFDEYYIHRVERKVDKDEKPFNQFEKLAHNENLDTVTTDEKPVERIQKLILKKYISTNMKAKKPVKTVKKFKKFVLDKKTVTKPEKAKEILVDAKSKNQTSNDIVLLQPPAPAPVEKKEIVLDTLEKVRIDYNERLRRIMEAEEALKKVKKPVQNLKLVLYKNKSTDEQNSETRSDTQRIDEEMKKNEQPENDNNNNSDSENEDDRDDDEDEVGDERNDSPSVDGKVDGHNTKIKFNTRQCYVCFKLFETKEKLVEHCQEHFDICSKKILKKCPLCPYVTSLQLPRHIRTIHKIKIKAAYGTLIKKDHQKYAIGIKERTYENENATEDIREIDVIPSVVNLNRQAYLKIDKKRREFKSKEILDSKLVKKGNEWVVSHEKVNLNLSEYFLPEFNQKYIKKVAIAPEDGYVEKMIKLKLVAKRQHQKMLAPCDICDKMCRNIAALKAHRKSHVKRPRVRRKPKIVDESGNCTTINADSSVQFSKTENSNEAGKESDMNLLEFYRNNIGGTDVEFEQFVKIFKKIDKVNDDHLEVLENNKKYGVPKRNVRMSRNSWR